MSYGEPVGDYRELSEFNDLDTTDIFARMIYSEAGGESCTGKVAVAYVAKNRADNGYMGMYTLREQLLKKYQFDGLTQKTARKPDTSSTAWGHCLDIAYNIDKNDNPIGDRLFFRATWMELPSGAHDVKTIGNQNFYNL